MSRVAVVTGSNKGIGFAIVKGLCQRFDGVVYLTSRDDKRGMAALAELNKIGLNPKYHQLDVADRNSVVRFRDHIKDNHGGLDILINNAAIVDSDLRSSNYENSKNVIDINFKSVITIQELIYPLVRNNGRILNISSDCGHLSNLRNKIWIERLSKKDLKIEDLYEFVDWFLESKKNGTFNSEDFADGGTVAAYRVAKMCLSAVTMIQQKELEGRNISVNSMHPGLVRTDMTTGVGFYSIDQAAETPMYLVLDAPQTLKGAYVWFDRKVLDWYDYNADYYFKIKTLVN
ncbi:carbonyl reductase [NADPH] 1-like [Vanessa atalanta]|uniref:carbonyl reductase [NADPH] 1-like n=1 Tax=Vanessa atalanta TaxID=42275 RepID=UPI001FCD636C|nr:carbonyl reductase [NADPH] 1-like [Vanessa atalanta]